MNFIKYDSPFYQGLIRIGQVIIINALWLLCSVPIITIGASTTAMYYCMFKMRSGEEEYIIPSFFKAFIRNFKQGTLLTIVFLVSGLFLYVDYAVYSNTDGLIGDVSVLIFPLLLTVWLMVISYAFPILAKYENTIVQIIRNSFLIGISNFGRTVLIVILNAIPIMLILLFPALFLLSTPVWLVCGIGIISYINSKLFVSIFKRFA